SNVSFSLHTCLWCVSYCYLPTFFLIMILRPRTSTLFPYTTLFRSQLLRRHPLDREKEALRGPEPETGDGAGEPRRRVMDADPRRSEEHTSELQLRENLVCRLLLEKKNHSRLDTGICSPRYTY